MGVDTKEYLEVAMWAASENVSHMYFNMVSQIYGILVCYKRQKYFGVRLFPKSSTSLNNKFRCFMDRIFQVTNCPTYVFTRNL